MAMSSPSKKEVGDNRDLDISEKKVIQKFTANNSDEDSVEQLGKIIAEEILTSGSTDHSGSISDLIATTVVEEMSDRFPELSRKSRPLNEVLEEFRELKLKEVNSTKQYNRKFDYIQEYFKNEIEATTTEEFTSEQVKRYKNWRKYESLDREKPLAKSTLRDDMYLFNELIGYMIEHGMVPARFANAVEKPEVDYTNGEGVDKKKLSPEVAKAALDYLRKYNYADVEHVVMELLCQMGSRRGGLVGRDTDDFDYNEAVLRFKHHPDTELKNNESSEREVDLFGDLPDIIQDYINDRRPSVTDEEGREPLLTKGDGRISGSMIKKIAYKWTRPCAVGMECPHDRDPDDCEAAQTNNSAYKCPDSRAPHHIRKGYITDQKNRGVSSDAINQRCDVSPRVQELHYDLPDDSEERERYTHEFENADEDPNSGFSQ